MKFKNLNIRDNKNKMRKFQKSWKITATDTLLQRIGQYLSDFPIYKRVVANNFRRRWLIMTCTCISATIANIDFQSQRWRAPRENVQAWPISGPNSAIFALYTRVYRFFWMETKLKIRVSIAKSWRIIKKSIIFLDCERVERIKMSDKINSCRLCRDEI